MHDVADRAQSTRFWPRYTLSHGIYSLLGIFEAFFRDNQIQLTTAQPKISKIVAEPLPPIAVKTPAPAITIEFE